MPGFTTFLITSRGNEGSDDLGRDSDWKSVSQAEIILKMYVMNVKEN